jgi:hypothetical protein
MAIDSQVDLVLKEIRTTVGGTWEGMTAEELRPWLNFSGIAAVGKFDFEGLMVIFDRKKLSDDYLKVRQEEKPKAKDIWVPKISSDLIAGFQRDHLMRTRSRVRLMMHAAARHKTNGQDDGPFTTNTISLISRIDPAQGG